MTTTIVLRTLIVIAVVALGWYVVFGLGFLTVPGASNDEGWIIARGVYQLEHGRPGDPILPESIAPGFERLFDAGLVSPAFGWCYYGVAASGVALAHADTVIGFRIAMFATSVLLLAATWALARHLNMTRSSAFVATALLAIVPEFMMQSHAERPEVLLAFCVAVSLFASFRVFALVPGARRSVAMIALGVLCWLPAILVHPSGMAIPPMIGMVYLIVQRDRLFHWRTVGLVAAMIPGALLFLDMMIAPGLSTATSQGSSLAFGARPPILVRSVWWFVKSPLHFHERMHDGALVYGQLASTIWFVAGFGAMIILWYYYRDAVTKALFVASLTIIATLTLFVYTTGHYNVLIAPMCSIAMARLLNRWSESARMVVRRSAVIATAALVLGLIAAVIPGVRLYSSQYDQYREVMRTVDSLVPRGEPVLAPAMYYPQLRDRRFVSNSWFGSTAGYIDQSFEEGFRALRGRYLILDDFALSLAVSKRSPVWAAEMMKFVNGRFERIGVVATRLYLRPNYVLGGITYPAEWGAVTEGYLTHVRVYRFRDTSQTHRP